MHKVTKIEIKNDRNGSPLKYTTFEDGRVVYVNSKYDASIYEQVVEGAEFELIKEGNFNKIKYDKMGERPAWAGKTNQIKEAVAEKNASIGKSMDRKENAITLAGTARDATLIVVNLYPELANVPDKEEAIKIVWEQWRTWLIEKSGDAKDITETKQPF